MIAALGWYVLLPLSSLVIGELEFFPWPHLFMMWLGWETWAMFASAQLIGAVAIVAVGLLVRRWRPFRVESFAKAVPIGLLLTAGTLALLLAGAFTAAVLLGWDTAA